MYVVPPRVVYSDGFNARQSFLNPDTEDEKVLFAPKRNPTLTLLLAFLGDELACLRSSQEVQYLVDDEEEDSQYQYH